MVTRLVGGLTPADGADPRTFPAIFNDAADEIEAVQSGLGVVESGLTGLGGTVVTQGSAIFVQGEAIADLQADVSAIEAWNLDDLNDVTVTTPANNQVLAYSTAVSGWVNSTAASGKILQVVSTTKTDTQSTSLNSGDVVAVTSLSASITPSSTASKILVQFSVNGANGGDTTALGPQYILKRGATAIGIGNSDGTRTRATTGQAGGTGQTVNNAVGLFLDSPNTTSATTYSVDVQNLSGVTQTIFINRSVTDSDQPRVARFVSTITLMEVAG